MTEDTRALHEYALVEAVPVAAGDRIIGWKVLLRGLPIGVVRPACGADACLARAYLRGHACELGIFPTRDAAALAIVAANTLHGYPPDVRDDRWHCGRSTLTVKLTLASPRWVYNGPYGGRRFNWAQCRFVAALANTIASRRRVCCASRCSATTRTPVGCACSGGCPAGIAATGGASRAATRDVSDRRWRTRRGFGRYAPST